ncbi:YjcZ family sporulation protein [Bacillus tianshenii]|nr:YjcZ family sporulation protein [Bacillus tianshenii]
MHANVNAPLTMGANVNAAPVAGAYAPMMPSYVSPSYGYAAPAPNCDTFVLIVVLFILLIIVGACCFPC